MGSDYGNQQYWDHRYENAHEVSYDWFFPYKAMKKGIYEALWQNLPQQEQTQVEKEQIKVLIVGCGNSELSIDMHKDGFVNLLSIDYSLVVIEHMQAKYPQLKWQVQDVRELSLPLETYDLVIDKGTLDSILCGTNSTESAAKMLKNIQQVLKPGGVFMEYTYGTPSTRLVHLEAPELAWKVETVSVEGRFLYKIKKNK